MDNKIIKIENLSVVYDLGKTSETWALKDINLEIFPQEYVIFFGPSGCGKSTLLYTIAGLEYPTKGKVIVEEKDLAVLTPAKLMEFHKKTIGMIFQAFYLILNLTVRDNIIFPQILAEQPVHLRKQRANVLLERFGLTSIKKRRSSLLSGGQQQRTAIARALINNPSIILADEPTGNLDSKNVEIVLNLLSELNEKDKKTIIHVTHDPRYIHRANRVFYMQDGKITRVVRNPERKVLTTFAGGEKEISELERIAQAYPYLTDTKLKAKLILNHILYPYGIETQDEVEKLIDDYLTEKINKREMKEKLDLPLEKGGVSLYKQTAKQMAEKIVALSEEIELIQEEKFDILTPVEEKSMTVRGFLLDTYSGKLSFEQIKRLEAAISQRIIGKFQKQEFEKVLDRPFVAGGVGLNRRTAKKFSREVELIIMKR